MNFAVCRNQSLRQNNSLGLQAYAEIVALPFNQQGVGEVYSFFPDKKIIPLGRGTNVVFSRKSYDSAYVFMNLKLLDGVELKDGELTGEAGATLSRLTWFALESNIAGFEFLEDIPGTIGGAVIMNAGTYKDNIGALVQRVRYYNIQKGSVEDRKVDRSDFRRRSSFLDTDGFVVLECGFRAAQGDYMDSLDRLLSIKRDRYEKQPRNFPNAGSVFKRPLINGEEVYVWKLINDAGLRGFRRNGAMISDKHTGFIVNTGGATYEDLAYLIELCQERVKKNFGIDLEPEWKII